MFQEMINGSIAVLTKPSVAMFEEHEKDNLTWALIYSVIAGVINAVLAAIKAVIFPPAAVDLSGLPPELAGGVQAGVASSPNILGAVLGSIIFTIIGLLIAWGITYGLGRAFGGTGKFGELAYDLSLFNAPSTVIFSVLNFIPILGGLAALALTFYNLYLTYLAIQSGMNLPSNKALYVILIQFAIGLVLALCMIVFFGAVIAAIIGASGGFDQ
ncbi:MAG: YIP1 family protein [Chloroflexales bacterium]|nr:YIP1 family protein [Chloroflexales bacterium]